MTPPRSASGRFSLDLHQLKTLHTHITPGCIERVDGHPKPQLCSVTRNAVLARACLGLKFLGICYAGQLCHLMGLHILKHPEERTSQFPAARQYRRWRSCSTFHSSLRVHINRRHSFDRFRSRDREVEILEGLARVGRGLDKVSRKLDKLRRQFDLVIACAVRLSART